MSDPIWLLESQKGWKVVLLTSGLHPWGGPDHPKCNYVVLMDCKRRAEAAGFAKRLRKS